MNAAIRVDVPYRVGAMLLLMLLGIASPDVIAQEDVPPTKTEATSSATEPSKSTIAYEKKKLDGRTRARLLSALAAFIILGFAMVTFTWLGARITRRYMHAGDDRKWLTAEQLRADDWAKKPLNAPPKRTTKEAE